LTAAGAKYVLSLALSVLVLVLVLVRTLQCGTYSVD
jgi:hypothetical protein